jgi:transposase, IS30 family
LLKGINYLILAPCLKIHKNMSHLTTEQRYVIAALYKRGIKKKEIAKEIKVDPSTVGREIKRNATKTGKYNAQTAKTLAAERKERFGCKRKFTKEVEQRIRDYLVKEQWSPEQIVGWCKKENIEMVSVERIYQFIRKDKANGGSLYKHTRHRLKHRKRPVGMDGSRIKDRISIEERPEKVNNREEFGHFEMDLVVGKNNQGAVLTMTERVSKFFMCRYLPNGKKAIEVAKTVNDMLLPYKNHVHSITTDNGLEFASHQLIAKKLNATIYFTHPYSSWEKGQIENMNKLLRQYIPKNEIINQHNTQNINEIQIKLNNRPRKNLGFEKPIEVFSKFINQKIAFAS